MEPHMNISEQFQKENRFLKLIKHFGPGLLISMAYLDPGNLAGDMTAGLVGQYSLLWVLMISTILGYYFQTFALQLGLVTGRDLATLCRESIPRTSRIFLWLMAQIAIIGSDIQQVLGTAIALKIMFDLPVWIGVILTVFNTLLILLVKYTGMRKLEGIFGFMLLTMAICFFVNLILMQPEYTQLVKGIFVPEVKKEAFLPMVGLIGAILMPHNLYLHSSLMTQKKVQIHKLNSSLFYFKMETAFSLFVSFLINVAVISSFATWANSDQKDEITLSTAGNIFETQLGSKAQYIWAIGLFAAGQSSTLSGTLAGQYVMSGFIQLNYSPLQRGIITRSVAIIPALVAAVIESQDEVNEYLNVLQAVQLPFAVIPLLKMCRSKILMRQYVMSDFTFYSLSILSGLIVFVNYYTNFPKKLSFTNVLGILVLFCGMVYFIFMIIILNTKLDFTINAVKAVQNEFNQLPETKGIKYGVSIEMENSQKEEDDIQVVDVKKSN